MLPQKFETRHWISVGLCILGLIVMPAVNLYYNRKDAISFSHFLEPYRWFQWLPFTVLFLLGASYTWSDGQWRLLAWIVFGLGMVLSAYSWLFMVGSH